jgi:hypothetical protein
MDAGGLAQMAHQSFNSAHGLAMPSGLASRRQGGQNIKPLSFDAMKSPTENDTGIPTPRTSRSHLLAGLRTAPKTSTGVNFNNGPASPTTFAPQARNRNSMNPGMYDNAAMFNGPKTSLPRFAAQHQQQQPQQPQQPQQQPQQSQGYNQGSSQYGQQYTAEQILAPPQLQIDESLQEQIDPNLAAQLMYTNAYLSEQQQRLQQQLRALQAAAQQFQGLNLGGQMQQMQQMQQLQQMQQMQMMQQAYPHIYQQQVQNVQAMMTPVTPQQNVYSVYDPATGQQTLYVDQSQAQAQAQLQAQLSPQFVNQSQLPNGYASIQNVGAPRVQVSPPPAENKNGFRNTSPPRRYDSPIIENPVPLPPPSANAFRRGHKKSSSTANGNKGLLSIATDEPPKSAGPKTANFPLTPMTAGYGPGQARAGEHPVRQPRNPPSMDELKAKPTAKHEGSKNFVTRTRRSAINNLVRAGLERRKDARSTGSISPISESTEEIVETPLTDNDSDSGRSGSGSLVDHDDAECSLPSSRTSTGSWGAIGSDRPSSRQKLDRNADSTNSSDNEGAREPGSFASLLKSSSRAVKAEPVDGQRKAPMLVLTSAEKRKLVA